MKNSVFDELQGVLKEMVITGGRVGATAEFYGALAHSSGLFQYLQSMVLGESDHLVRLLGEPWKEVVSGLDHVLDRIDDSDFPVVECGFRRVHLIRLDANTPEEVLQVIDARGFRPASNYELINLGRQYPDLQRWYKIIAPKIGRVLVLQTIDDLQGSGPERVLYKYETWRGWSFPTVRFAVVLK